MREAKEREGMLSGLKVIPLRCCLELLCCASWNKDLRAVKLALSLFIELREHFQSQIEELEEEQGQPEAHKSGIEAFFTCHEGSRASEQTKLQSLWKELSGCEDSVVFPGLGQLHKLNLQTFRF